MYKQRSFLFFTLLLLGTCPALFSQISVSPSSGCMPAGITNALFTYVGSGTPTNIVWDYGDGSPTSTLTSTQHSYPNLGNYTVTFHAIVGGVPVTYSQVVKVYNPPTGNFNFSLPASHCVGMTVSFTGNSSVPNAAYTWAFGDLGGANGSPVSHGYNAAGIYTPNVTIQDPATGCFVTVSGSPIKVSDPPHIVITSNPGLFSCSSSFATAFDASGSTSGSPVPGGGLTYNWSSQFGSSTQASAGPWVFTPVGSYNVNLTVTDNNSCSSSSVVTVKLESPTVTAVVPPSVCVAPQTAPPFAPFFATVSSNQLSTTWDMGDGTVLTFPPPPLSLQPNTPYTGTIHVYYVPGPKTVSITVQAGPCVTTITKTIFVEKITPDFVGVPPSFTCSPTFTAGITNLTTVNSLSSLSYTWHVRHWNDSPVYSSNQTNPTFTVTQGSLNPYTNYNHPPYIVKATLNVKSAVGCIAEIKDQVIDTILRPTAMFESEKVEGCAPLSLTFTNTSVTKMKVFTSSGATLTPNYPIYSYTYTTWHSTASISSGTTATGLGPTIPPVPFTYSAGVYYATLSITTGTAPGGCAHTSFVHTITAVDPPVISYILPSSPVCAGQPFQIQLSSPGPTTETPQHWHVEGDGGLFSSCVSDAAPTWTLHHPVPSPQTFTISAYLHGCKSTVITTPLATSGPASELNFETKCTGNRKTVTFYYHLEDVTSATLDFGNGSTPLSITGAPGAVIDNTASYTYLVTGNYIATLTAVNPACGVASTNTVFVKVRNLTPNFVLNKSVICKDSVNKADASSSIDVFTTQKSGFTWFIDNNEPLQTGGPQVSFTNTNVAVGTHTVRLEVKDENGCKADITKYYRVSAPVPDFTFNKNPICFSDLPVQAINLTDQSIDAVSNYTWYTGDNILYQLPPYPRATNQTSIAGTTPNHSPFFSYPTLNGSQSLTFTVTLMAKNIYNCLDSTEHVLTVNDPKINASPDKYTGCIPANRAANIITAPSHISYTINYGDGTGNFVVNSPFSPTIIHPHTFLTTGLFNPVVTVKDFGGCIATSVIGPIEIQSAPAASFTFENVVNHETGKDKYCAPFSPSVTSTTPDIFPLTYTWDLGLHPAQTTTANSATDNYPDAEGVYTIIMKVETRPAGCAASAQSVVTVFSPKIDFDLDPDALKNTYCLGEPISVKIKDWYGLQNGYQWDFGDGHVTQRIFPLVTIPSTLRATYTNTYYPSNTNGVLTIEVVGYAGQEPTICKDVKRKNVNIIRVKPGFMRNNELAVIDTMHCLGTPELFKNQSSSDIGSGLTYTWTLGDGTVSTNTDVPYTYAAPGTYSVKLNVLDPVYNCTASIAKTMTIFPLPAANFSLIPFSCPGTPFLVNGSGSPGVSGVLTGTLQPGAIPVNFSSTNNFSLSTTASVSTTYSLKVTDSNGCENSAATASIFVQQPAPEVHWDTTVVIGQPIPLNAYAGPGFSYSWTPLVSYLNCDTCRIYNPVSTSTIPITYSVMVEDGKQCSVVKNTYRINIDIIASLDVPSAFTPNADGINDFIFPDGWGLRKLNYFRVFNRWGQLVFETNELKAGWDGIFRGVPQNIETYVYQASADTYSEKEPTITKTGTFKLLR